MATAFTGKRKRENTASESKPIKKKAASEARTNGSKISSKPYLHSDSSNNARGKPSSMAAVTDTAPIGATTDSAGSSQLGGHLHLQIVTGSYERVLHGIAAQIPLETLPTETGKTSAAEAAATQQTGSASNDTGHHNHAVTFSDSFLFAAHASAIRCLAISPPAREDADKVYLATGSSDERINLYSLSTAPPPARRSTTAAAAAAPPFLLGTGTGSTTTTAENPRNRSLGSLAHHDRAITRLHFPTRAKLFSAAEDATIAISRTRDWTMLSSVKAPIPKPQGRPSGDTAAPGEIPAGVNDFAIHPSQKLMLSVGRGEKCMRLWNLMTGKKAGVLNFDRDLLACAGETKSSTGEGRRVLWDAMGENYVVGFERGAALFGIDSQPKAIIQTSPASKIHEMRFLSPPSAADVSVLAVSTEDGRICFFNCAEVAQSENGKLPLIPAVSQLGGQAAGIDGRVKDFDVVKLPADNRWIVVTASSDGAVRLWVVTEDDVSPGSGGPARQVGALVATQETGSRITCLGAFILNGKVSKAVREQEEAVGAEEQEENKREEEDDDSEAESDE